MAQVLLYNLTGEKLLKIKLTLLSLGIPAREVLPGEYHHPLSYLLGRPGSCPGLPGESGSFTEEMLLMDGLHGKDLDRFLDTLRARDAVVSLKAMATETNSRWTSLQLYQELKKEHAAMSRLAKSVHRKKK